MSFKANDGIITASEVDCSNDELSQLSSISQVRIKPDESVPLRNLVHQSRPECPLLCSLTDESSFVNSFDSHTGDIVIEYVDTVEE